jgi:hypothetical protein
MHHGKHSLTCEQYFKFWYEPADRIAILVLRPYQMSLQKSTSLKISQLFGKRTIDGELLDVRGAAAPLGVTEKTLRARVSRHQVPFRVWGARVVFVRAELEKFLDELPGNTLDESGLEKVNEGTDGSV